MRVDVEQVRFSYGGGPVLRDVSFSAGDGELVAVLGPNGVGKSTLFRCLLGFLRPDSGTVRLDGRAVEDYPSAQLSRLAAYIPQSASPAFNYTVLDMVTMGMTGQLRLLETPGPEHREKATAALESLGIGSLAHRGCHKISGGERQLMLLARALVQEAGLLIMDEPTASLDYGNSFRVMGRIRDLGRRGFTVIFSTHEPNQAFRYADRVLALRDGAVLADGPPRQVLTEPVLSALYGIPVAVRQVDLDGVPCCVSLPME